MDAISGNYSTTSPQVIARFYNNPTNIGNGINSSFISLQTSPDGGNYNPVAQLGVVGEAYNSNNGSFVVATRDATGISERMRVNSSGNVSIGTSDPKGYKLAVNGNAIAESVTVKLHSSWPDYVFKPKYNLLPLSLVKTFIDKNQHLPDMPSEAEMKENGINLGEIVRLQTKKIEELTLYLIKQNEQIIKQSEQIVEQKSINKSLQRQISRLAKLR